MKKIDNMNSNKNIILTLALLLMPLMMGAQALHGSYFIDSSVDRNKLNPAFVPRSNYFQLPAIGNLGVGLYTNWLGAETFLYPLDNGKVATFLHPEVSVDDFNKKFPERPFFDADVELNILSFGFFTKRKSFITFDLGVKADIDTDLPGDLFRFLKQGTGMGGGSFNIANTNLYGNAFVHASLGYSKDMSFLLEGLRIGARARFIAPMAHAGLNLENARLTYEADNLKLNTEGYLNVALSGLELEIPEVTPETESLDIKYEYDYTKLLSKPTVGWGYSFDFGFEYVLSVGSFLDGLTVSAAVVDLGKINYDKPAVASYSTSGEYVWNGFNGVGLDTDFEAGVNDMLKDLKSGLLKLEKQNSGAMSMSTMPRFYAGLEIPFFKRKMSAGLLYSMKKSYSYARQDLTASLNITPTKGFALGVNYSFLNTDKCLGVVLELTPRVGPALRIGTDYIFFQYIETPYLNRKLGVNIPMLPSGRSSLNFNFGLAFNLGSRHMKNEAK